MNDHLEASTVGVFDQPQYTVRELAHRMGLHPDTVRDHCRSGRCPARMIGGSVGYVITEAQRLEYDRTFQPA